VDDAGLLDDVAWVLVCFDVVDIAGCVVGMLSCPGDVLNIVDRVLDVPGCEFDFVDVVVCLVEPLI
jgi:hypothetical protein